MVENKKIQTYEYYCNIIDTMLSDMSNVTLNDIQDVMDELHTEINKIEIEEKEDEMSADKTNRGEY